MKKFNADSLLDCVKTLVIIISVIVLIYCFVGIQKSFNKTNRMMKVLLEVKE
jgi:hypothetical protein